MAVAEALPVPTRTVWHADPDPGASAILAHHWPTVPNLGDITTIDWASVPPVDVLAAGFPCQDVSLAGRRAGIAEGTRSGLWAHVARAISVLRPRIVVIENVRGLLSASADGDVEPCAWCVGDAGGEPPLRALGAVLGDLARLGFDAQWASVRASDVGAPHQRERVFLLAWPADTAGAGLETGREGRPGGDAAADAQGDGRLQGRPEPARLVGGPDAAERGGAAPADADGGGLAGHSERDRGAQSGKYGVGRLDAVGRRVQRPAASDADGGGRGPGLADLRAGKPDARWGAYAAAIARWGHATGRPAPAPTGPGRTGQRRLSAEFVEWLMGLPAGHVTAVPGLTRTQQLRALGNGVVPQQGAAALRLLLDRAGLYEPPEVAA